MRNRVSVIWKHNNPSKVICMASSHPCYHCKRNQRWIGSVSGKLESKFEEFWSFCSIHNQAERLWENPKQGFLCKKMKISNVENRENDAHLLLVSQIDAQKWCLQSCQTNLKFWVFRTFCFTHQTTYSSASLRPPTVVTVKRVANSHLSDKITSVFS